MMKKIYRFLLVLLVVITLASCSKKATKDDNNNSNDNNISKYEPLVTSFNHNKSIKQLKFINIPEEAIQIGYFGSSNILLEAEYTDGTTDRIHITEKMFSEDKLDEFKTPGKKYFDFIYMNNHIPLRFELKEAETPAKFTVNFVDKDGNLLESKTVKYLDGVKYTGNKNLSYVFNNRYYKYVDKWDQNLNHIYANITTKPLFEECAIEYSYDDYYKENGYLYNVVATSGTADAKKALVYIGRLNNSPLVSLGTKTREHYKDTEYEYDIDKNVSKPNFLNAYSETVKNRVLNAYYHEVMQQPFYDSYVFNAYLLSIDSTNFIRDLSDVGFNPTSLTPVSRSGYATSYKSLFNIMYVDPLYNTYMADNSNLLSLQEDDLLGNYELCLMADLDIYLYLDFSIRNDYGTYNYYLSNVQLAVTYVAETVRMDYVYKKDNNESYSNDLLVSNAILSDTLTLSL